MNGSVCLRISSVCLWFIFTSFVTPLKKLTYVRNILYIKEFFVLLSKCLNFKSIFYFRNSLPNQANVKRLNHFKNIKYIKYNSPLSVTINPVHLTAHVGTPIVTNGILNKS